MNRDKAIPAIRVTPPGPNARKWASFHQKHASHSTYLYDFVWDRSRSAIGPFCTDADGNIILELGTNHHEFNAKNLRKLKEGKELFVFLCLLSKEECLKREEQRDRVIEKKAMLKKFERNFPESHEKDFEAAGLNYHYLQMGQSLGEQIKSVEEAINE